MKWLLDAAVGCNWGQMSSSELHTRIQCNSNLFLDLPLLATQATLRLLSNLKEIKNERNYRPLMG